MKVYIAESGLLFDYPTDRKVFSDREVAIKWLYDTFKITLDPRVYQENQTVYAYGTSETVDEAGYSDRWGEVKEYEVL